MLLFQSNNRKHLEDVLRVSRIINDSDRDWLPKDHPELKNYLSSFNEPVCVCLFSTIITCMLIEPVQKKRLLSVAIIEGSTTTICNLSKTNIIKYLSNAFYKDDFMPSSYSDQIYYVPYKKNKSVASNSQIEDLELINSIHSKKNLEDEIEMIVFTEYNSKGKVSFWTIDTDITKPEQKTSMKISVPNILQNILKGI